ncbi:MULTISPECIES: restriction endonuclease subunit S [Exiguobacterium]|uniref:restriction endonuclease subunit S n=1 Tax=Exiguobacterium TaxID=33986 RepID=UPI001AE4EF63|nr:MULTISPECIES: restriction endonuclease subunit S [Exiguobacterium]MCT4778858.1 restriction endonuclease subunit S [Exiguobacterium soli]
MSQELWSKKKITWLFDVIGSGTTPSASNESYYNSPDKAWLNTGDLTDGYIEKTSKYVSQIALEKYSALTVFPKESLVMAMYGATIGKLGITKYETTTNQACCVLAKPKDILTKFVFYWLMAHRIEIINLSQGGGQPNISQGIIKNIRIAVPSIELQNKIVSLVDKKFEEINHVIKQKEKVMALLKQQIQSIITESVTKGLNPNVKMKKSGVEWIGEIPEHWKIKKIKHITQVKRGASPRPIDNPMYFDDDGEFAWVRIADVSKSGMYLNKTLQALSELGSSLSVKQYPGDLFVSIAGTVGKPCITNIKCCIHDGFVYFHDYQYNNKFLYYIFASGQSYKGLGKMGTQLNLNTDTIGEIKIPWPPVEEQDEIISKLQENISKIDNLVEIVANQIEKLKEYRQSLIYEMVTGKIDVRNIEID